MAKTPIQTADVSQTFKSFSRDMVLLTYTAAPYTAIVNRALMVDLANDLSARIGSERLVTEAIYELPEEQGASGERVFGVVNDQKGQIRFVGKWARNTSSYGTRIQSGAANDYVEISFYGTGLDVLVDSVGSRDIRATVDGGAEGSNLITSNNDVLGGVEYSPNYIVRVAQGLSEGLHTIKIRVVSGAIGISGFQTWMESTTINVRPGNALVGGGRVNLSSAQSVPYASSFTNVYGTAGTRGGRVLLYLDKNGAVRKDIRYTRTSQQNLSSASHTDEEIIRKYHCTEFGFGRVDDFSSGSTGSGIFPSVISATGCLEDGSTTLVGAGVSAFGPGGAYSSQKTSVVVYASQNPGFIHITFFGTGLDITLWGDGTANRQFDDVHVNGSTVGSIASTTYAGNIVKIVSGLPLGQHTVKLFHTNLASTSMSISDFLVYGPKKPALPEGAFALGEYFILADATASAAGGDSVGNGQLTKSSLREVLYNGTGWAYTPGQNGNRFGNEMNTNVTNDWVELTFWGTGFEVLGRQTSSQSVRITVDGVNYAGTPTVTGGSWSSPDWTMTSSLHTLRVTGLSLGKHRVRVTNNAVAGNTVICGFNVIAPIHTPSDRKGTVFSNSVALGNTTIKDLRVFPVDAIESKCLAQIQDAGATPTMNANFNIPMQKMSAAVYTDGGPLEISYSMTGYCTSGAIVSQLSIGGELVGRAKRNVNTSSETRGDTVIVQVSPGVHMIDLFWKNDASSNSTAEERTLTVKKA